MLPHICQTAIIFFIFTLDNLTEVSSLSWRPFSSGLHPPVQSIPVAGWALGTVPPNIRTELLWQYFQGSVWIEYLCRPRLAVSRPYFKTTCNNLWRTPPPSEVELLGARCGGGAQKIRRGYLTYFIHAMNTDKHLIYTTSFSLSSSLWDWHLLLWSLYYRWGDWDSGTFIKLPNITQAQATRTCFQTLALSYSEGVSIAT